MSNNGFLVISLDFELYWGMFDKVTLEEYGENVKGVHIALPEILALFTYYQIHATWATVGMLMANDRQNLQALLKVASVQPTYPDMKVSAYEYLKNNTIGENATSDSYHYGAHLVTKIIATKNQELGSHTFSHYYCLDGVENSEAIFEADCEAFQKAASPFNQRVTSIVFPRNQTTSKALATCKKFGFTTYRGTPKHFLYTGKKEVAQTNLFLRGLRLIDTYINLSGHHTYSFSTIYPSKEGLINVPGSWFFRPYSIKLRFLESLKMRRIKKAMTYAAKHNEIYHLWWHPHNFGINRKENLQNLTEILNHFKNLQARYSMQSANMNDIVSRS